jgi:hypothetical protein
VLFRLLQLRLKRGKVRFRSDSLFLMGALDFRDTFLGGSLGLLHALLHVRLHFLPDFVASGREACRTLLPLAFEGGSAFLPYRVNRIGLLACECLLQSSGDRGGLCLLTHQNALIDFLRAITRDRLIAGGAGLDRCMRMGARDWRESGAEHS